MATALPIIAGILSWSLAEYLLHRYLGHELNTTIRFKKEHLKHHFIEDYFAPTGVKALVAVIVVSVLWGALMPLMGLKSACLYSISFTGLYLFYEYLHRRIHVQSPRTRLGRYLKVHHLHHHKRGVKGNYGVTSPIWDVAFGTYLLASRAGGSGCDKEAHAEHDEACRELNKNRRTIS